MIRPDRERWFVWLVPDVVALCFRCSRRFEPEAGYDPLQGCHGTCRTCRGTEAAV